MSQTMQTAYILIALLCTTSLRAQSQADVKTVLNGVYSSTQAERGRIAYTTYCTGCHADSLEGVSAPALTGARFLERWREGSLESLYNFIRQTMPFGRVAAVKISDAEYLDILTHILRVNQYPAGPAELRADALGRTILVGKNGPQPVPDGAHVVTVGCLKNANEQWVLSGATEPTRTPTDLPTNHSEVKPVVDKKLGILTFRLTDLEAVPDFSPTAHNGQIVQAKGFLTRQPNAERISLTSIEALDQNCGE